MKTLITILLSFSLTCQAQENLKHAAYNVISSSLISGIGSGFHKKANETFGHAFVNGLWKGAIGGAVIYSGKELVRFSSKNNTLNYVWPARALNALGSSMVYNGLNNDKILQSVSMNIYFTNISFDGKLHAKVDPFTLVSGVVLACNNRYSFNLESTVKTGSIVFDKSFEDIQMDNGKLTIKQLSGQSFGNIIFRNVYTDFAYGFIKENVMEDVSRLDNYTINTTCHELIHTFQYENSYFFDFSSKYVYINPSMGINYLINSLSGYRNNLFEKEANYFGYSNY